MLIRWQTIQMKRALLRKMGIKSHIGKITQKQLHQADEIFVTNSIIEVMPVTSFKDNKIFQFKEGKITLRLKAQYQQLVKERLAG